MILSGECSKMKFKRKKNIRQRGNTTHGWGARKKHRGSGNRGGFGMAGTGKRADQKKPTVINLYGPGYFGRHGFKRKNTRKIVPINISGLEKFKTNKINLKKEGYNKLLGTGKVRDKYEITVEMASKKAINKIEATGGKIILTGTSVEEKPSEKEE